MLTHLALRAIHALAHHSYFYIGISKDTFICSHKLWLVKIHEYRTPAIYFLLPNRIILNNVAHPWKDDNNYLGVILDKRSTFRKHILHIKGNECRRIKKLIHKASILFIMSKTSPIWGFICKSSMEYLSKIYNRNISTIQNKFRYHWKANISFTFKYSLFYSMDQKTF